MEYKNENIGSLWLADKQTKNGDKYYNGSIYIGTKEYKITMFVNKSDNPKAPQFRLKVNQAQEEQKTSYTPSDFTSDDVFKEFGDTVEIADEDLAF